MSRLLLAPELCYALSSQAITDVWVHGRSVVRDGRLVSADGAEILAQVRVLTREWKVAT